MKRALVGLMMMMAMPSTASAQQYLMAGVGDVATGGEGAGHGMRRARTRLRVGLELRIDEQPNDGIIASGLVDLEPRAAFGGELRYVRILSETFSISGGGLAYLAPGTLFGGCAGLEARIPMAKKLWFTGGPEATVFALGSDLPNNSVVWQALVQVGLRADF